MAENNGTGVLTGAEVMARGRRTIALPDGGDVVVGRIPLDELTEILGGIPDVSVLATASEKDAAAIARRPESKAVLGMMDRVILAGVIEPQLFRDPRQGASPRDFSIDEKLLLFKEILTLSSYTKEAGGKVLPLSKTVA